MDFVELIASRKSIRTYSGEPICSELIDRLGRFAVDEVSGEKTVSRFFADREDAIDKRTVLLVIGQIDFQLVNSTNNLVPSVAP